MTTAVRTSFLTVQTCLLALHHQCVQNRYTLQQNIKLQPQLSAFWLHRTVLRTLYQIVNWCNKSVLALAIICWGLGFSCVPFLSLLLCEYDTCCRVVTKISSCRVNTTSRRGIKRLGISFGSIFLLFSIKVAGSHSLSSRGKSPAPGSWWQPCGLKFKLESTLRKFLSVYTERYYLCLQLPVMFVLWHLKAP